MRRRDKAGGKAIKAQRHKTLTRGKVPKKSARRRKSSVTSLNEKVTLLAHERDELLQQQTATADVLKAISRSAFDLKTVLDALIQAAARLCEADQGAIAREQDGVYQRVATYGYSNDFKEYVRALPVVPERGTAAGRALLEAKVVHIPDVLADSEYTFAEGQKLGGFRTVLDVPMLREGRPIGVLSLTRPEVRPFTDKQIELVKTFATQAVIAIENTRLLNEQRQSLEQQTATSEVLKVISSSPGDLRPVFQSMLENSVRICEAQFGQMFLCEGDKVRAVAYLDVPAALVAWDEQRGAFQPSAEGGLMRAIRTKKVIHIDDFMSEQPSNPVVKLGGARSYIAVPMLKESELVGVIVIYRQEVRPFSNRQIDLVQNFAAQAVIAIENTRLLNELRESLQQQTATADVLKVISSSSGDLGPVFQTLLENAVRICSAKFGNLFLSEGDALRAVAIHDAPQAYVEERRRNPIIRPGPKTALGRAMTTKQRFQIADIQNYEPDLPDAATVKLAKLAGARTVLVVPMLKENELVGAIVIYRQDVRPFTDKQINLVENFASQAVIAIENARLLNDLNKLNQQLEQRVTDQVGEIERMGKLRRFLPPQVADLIVASGTEKQLESHRREITALFCDLRGFTGFSESSDPEDVMALLREYHASIGEIINKYGGTLERYAGDGVMVVFNDPIPVDNPALQAVLMAIDMRAAIGTLIEKWRKLGHDIGFGIGIAHGFATLGTIGFEGRFDYAAIGTVSNVASRLCDEAKPSQILISPRVLMAVEDAISSEPIGEFKLKGISRPLAAYNVLSAISTKI
jgi:GAF domain-containing protein